MLQTLSGMRSIAVGVSQVSVGGPQAQQSASDLGIYIKFSALRADASPDQHTQFGQTEVVRSSDLDVSWGRCVTD